MDKSLWIKSKDGSLRVANAKGINNLVKIQWHPNDTKQDMQSVVVTIPELEQILGWLNQK